MEFIASLFESSYAELVYIAIAILAGSILRGISGFGFSLTLIVVMSLFMSPAKATSYILLWEILASIVHLPFVWRQVQWKTVKWLTVGVLIGTPLGVALLVYIPPAPMTILINATVIILSLIMLKGYHLSRHLTPLETTGTGIISGIINGASANGGPPVILLFFSSPSGAAAGRASIIAYFLFTDLWASAIFVQQGMTNFNTLLGALIYTPLIVVGLWIGSKLYGKIEEKRFKKIVISGLLVISGISCIRAFMS